MYSNEDAEKNVVGSVLVNAAAAVKLMVLKETDFTVPECRQMFKAIKALYEAKEAIDITTVGTYIADKKLGVTPAQLLQIYAYVPTAANVGTYIKRVQECTERRSYRLLGMAIEKNSESGDLAELADNIRRQLNMISVSGGDWITFNEVMMRTLDRAEAVAKGELKSIGTGLAELDRHFNGFFPGELTILAARPAVGKSALGLFIAMEAAKKGSKVAIVSREMSPEAIGQRAASSAGRLTGSKIRTAELNDEDWVALGDIAHELSGLSIQSIYTCRRMEDLHQKARKLKEQEGLDLLIVDYAQLMHMGDKTDSRTEELEAVSGSLKELAMDLNIPVLALAQVKRSGMRTAVMPTMDELKGSGSFEQDADNILLMHRPDSDDDSFIEPQDRELRKGYMAKGLQYIVIRVAKQRQGEVFTTSVCFDPAHNKYTGIGR